MSGKATLSDRRISSAAREVDQQVETGYQQVFPGPRADEQFFADYETARIAFSNRTKKRPITPREVATAQRLYRDACRIAMSEAKTRERTRTSPN